MKLKLIDDTVYEINRAEVVDGRLEIDITDKTAEEVQTIFTKPENLKTIYLITDIDEVFSVLDGWTKYGGVMLNGDIKTAILIKPTDVTEERIASIGADALKAKQIAEEQMEVTKKIEQANEENGKQITDIQLALCEIYEGLGV